MRALKHWWLAISANQLIKLMLNIFFNVKKKEVEPKIYSILYRIDFNNRNFVQALWTGIAYSLEEAAEYALQTTKKENPNIQAINHTVLAHNIITLKDLHAMLSAAGAMEVIMTEDKIEIELDDKQKLMKTIISKKDSEMLKQNQTKFSKAEVKYIEEEIKK